MFMQATNTNRNIETLQYYIKQEEYMQVTPAVCLSLYVCAYNNLQCLKPHGTLVILCKMYQDDMVPQMLYQKTKTRLTFFRQNIKTISYMSHFLQKYKENTCGTCVTWQTG